MDNFNKIKSACRSAEPSMEKIRNNVIESGKKNNGTGWIATAVCCILVVCGVIAFSGAGAFFKKNPSDDNSTFTVNEDNYFLLPGIISKERMENEILSKITSESDRDKISSFYILYDKEEMTDEQKRNIFGESFDNGDREVYVIGSEISNLEALYLENNIINKYCPDYNYSELRKDCERAGDISHLITKNITFHSAVMVYDRTQSPMLVPDSFTLDNGTVLTFKNDLLYADGVQLFEGDGFIWQLALADINGDGEPELCADMSFGYGIIDFRIIVYDYINKTELLYLNGRDEGADYFISVDDGMLGVTMVSNHDVGAEYFEPTHGLMSVRGGTLRVVWDDENKYHITYNLGELDALFTAKPEKAECGETVIIKAVNSSDIVLHVFADGNEIQTKQDSGDELIFTFVIPEKQSNFTFEITATTEKSSIEQNPHQHTLFPKTLPIVLESNVNPSAYGIIWILHCNGRYLGIDCGKPIAAVNRISVHGYEFIFQSAQSIHLFDCETACLKTIDSDSDITEEEAKILYDNLDRYKEMLVSGYQSYYVSINWAFEGGKNISAFNGVTPEEPSQELLGQIYTDCFGEARSGERMYISRYYGTYDDAVVFRIDGGIYAEVITCKFIAGYLIVYCDSNSELVWKDGKIMSLDEAYKLGVLTEDQIGNVVWLNSNGKFISLSYSPDAE